MDRTNILFYASLNETAIAEYAKGNPVPLEGYIPRYDSILFRKGAVAGEATGLSKTLEKPVPYWLDVNIARDYIDKNIGALRWEGKGNALPEEGTMSFWMRPLDWESKGSDRFIAHMLTEKSLNFVWAPYYGVVPYTSASREDRDTYRQLRKYLSLTPDREHNFTIAWKPGETFYWIDGESVGIGPYPGPVVPPRGNSVDLIALGSSDNYHTVFADLIVLDKAAGDTEAKALHRRGVLQGSRSFVSVPQIKAETPDKERMLLIRGWNDAILRIANNDPSEARICYDETSLHIYFTYPIPTEFRENRVLYVGQPLEMNARENDAPSIFKDDHFRVVISPDEGKTLYTFASNAHMSRYDARNGDISWNAGKWRTLSSVSGDDYWNMEFHIPFSEIGIDKPQKGDFLMFNLFHRSVRVEDFDSAWAMTGREIVPLAVITLGGEEAVRIEDLTNPSGGNFSATAKVLNINDARLQALLITNDAEEVDTEKMELKPPEEKAAAKIAENPFSAEKTATVSLSAGEPLCGDILVNVYDGGGNLFYRQRLPFVFTLETTASAAFLPTVDKLVVKLDAGSASVLAGGVSADVKIFDGEGKEVLSAGIEKMDTVMEEVDFNTSGLSSGSYSIKTVFTSAGVRLPEISLAFEKKEKPVWLGNKLGCSEKVPWPWTDMKADGRTISCRDKEFRYAGSVFPSEIRVLGENILSAPSTLKLSSGKNGYTSEKASMKITKNTPSAVEFTCEEKLGAFTVKTHNRLEFDGFMWIRMEVLPGNTEKELDKLVFSLPFKSEYATHWFSGEYPVESKSGYTPSEEYISSPVSGIRVGGYEQGIQWTWQSLKGWMLENPGKAMRFIPGREEFKVEFTLIDHPVKISGPVVIEFGLHALPARPYPAPGMRGNWWAWAGHKNLRGINWLEWPSPGGRKVEIGSHQSHVGGRWNYLNLPDEYIEGQKKRALSLNERIKDGYQWGPYLNHYITETNPNLAPETEYYYEEWRCVPSGRPDFKSLASSSESSGRAQVCYGSKSYQDYYVYYFHRFFSKFHNPEAIPFATYFDVSHPMACANTDHGCGYVDEKGERHAETPILAWRNTIKRLYTIMKEMGHDNWMTTHMSGDPGMAYWAFNDVLIPGEQWAAYMVMKKAQYKAAGKEWPVSYTLTLPMERYRAEFSPWIWGPQTAFLSQSYSWLEAGDNFNDRHWCAINMVHDAFPYHSMTYVKLFPFLREFGWDDTVECLPYWKNGEYIKIDIYHQDRFVATLWKRDGKLLALFFNNTDEDMTAAVDINFEKLGIKKIQSGKLIDAETKEIFNLKGASVDIPVKKRDFRLLFLQE